MLTFTFSCSCAYSMIFISLIFHIKLLLDVEHVGLLSLPFIKNEPCIFALFPPPLPPLQSGYSQRAHDAQRLAHLLRQPTARFTGDTEFRILYDQE